MNSLTDRLEQYLAIRRRFGYDLTSSARELRPFVTFADAQGAASITVNLFLRGKEHFGSASTLTWFFRLCHVRSFAKWLQGVDPRTEVPPAGLIPGRQRRPRPYIYTDREIARIVTEGARLPSDYGLRGLNCSTLFGLLAVTGLRVSEAVGLDDRDVDLDAAVLQVRHAKNRKSRVIPVTACTAVRLGACRAARNRILGTGAMPFFVNEGTRRLTVHTARYNLAQICQRNGLREQQLFRRNGHGPRLHDMRHSMAVKTMLDWYRKGLNPDREMYKLSTYLGHTNPKDTYWYLKAVPELLRLASERAERAFTEGDGP